AEVSAPETKEISKPEAAELPKPGLGAGLPKPPAGIGMPKPPAGLGIPKPVVPAAEVSAPETKEVSKPESAELPKPGLGAGLPKPPAGIGMPKPPAGLGIPKPVVPAAEVSAPGIKEVSKPESAELPKPGLGAGLPKPPAGIGMPKPPHIDKISENADGETENKENKGPKLLKGMLEKPEVKPLAKPSLLKPAGSAKKLMGFGEGGEQDENKLKFIPKPPGTPPPQSLGAAAAGDASVIEDSGIDVNSIDKKELFNCVRPLLDRLVIELRRSFDYFKTQLNGGQISKIILTGGSAKLNGLDIYLSKRLELPIEIFNPIEGFEAQGLTEKSHEYSVALGLGLRNIYNVFPININLIPDDITLRRRKVKQKKNIIILSVFLIIALIEAGLYGYLEYVRKSNEFTYLENEYKNKYEPILTEVNTVKAKKEGFEKVKTIIETIQNDKAKWLNVLSELFGLLTDKFGDGLKPSNIWIESIGISGKDKITITGIAKTYDTIKNFTMRLGETKHFVPAKEPPTQQEVILNEKKYYRFTIAADIKHSIPAEEVKPEEKAGENKEGEQQPGQDKAKPEVKKEQNEKTEAASGTQNEDAGNEEEE
nr:pilus assembly protein PilM [Candidatus Dependentiae bacterium]